MSVHEGLLLIAGGKSGGVDYSAFLLMFAEAGLRSNGEQVG